MGKKGGTITRIIGGSSSWLAEEDINVIATNGNLVISSPQKVCIKAEKQSFADYDFKEKKEPVTDGDFIPVVEIDKSQIGKSNFNNTWKYEGFKIINSKKKKTLDKYIEKSKRKQKTYIVQLEKEENGRKKQDIVVRFLVKKGHKDAGDSFGLIRIETSGVNISSLNYCKTSIAIGYNSAIALRILKKDIKENAYIKFFADDHDLFSNGKQNIFCGKVKIRQYSNIEDAYFTDIDNEKEKVKKGFVGQKVKLVAKCKDNSINGKEVIFKLFEKKTLLTKKKKPLRVMQNNKETTEIKATAKNGYAIAEIKLCPEKVEDYNKWLSSLKISGAKPSDRKKSYIYIKVKEKSVLKSFKNKLKLISTNWHEPVNDPQICLWNSMGVIKPQSNTFGEGRGRLHTGLDIFALEGTNTYACLDAIVYKQKWHSGYGHTVTLKIDNPQELVNRKRNYTHAYPTDLNSKSKFKENESPIYLFYAHLSDVFVNVGEKVKAGDLIGKTGISGVPGGTYDPHLHLNIFSTIYAIGKGTSDYLADPALYVHWKTENELTELDKKIQESRKKEGKNNNQKNYKPKLSN